MKFSLLLMIFLVIGAYAESDIKWFTPTDKKVTWEKAKQVCKDNGGKLPTVDELTKVVTDCGGIIAYPSDDDWENISDKNKANKAYQSCYKKKGFSSSFPYWSSISMFYASFVYFGDGSNLNINDKTNKFYVRCVRD